MGTGSIERKPQPVSLWIPLSKHYAQAVRLRRPTLYPLSYRRAASDQHVDRAQAFEFLAWGLHPQVAKLTRLSGPPAQGTSRRPRVPLALRSPDGSDPRSVGVITCDGVHEALSRMAGCPDLAATGAEGRRAGTSTESPGLSIDPCLKLELVEGSSHA